MFNRAFEKARKESMTPEKIMKIAVRDGRFSVSLRYRDDWLRARCQSLVEQKKLKRYRRDGKSIFHGCYMYAPVVKDKNDARQ